MLNLTSMFGFESGIGAPLCRTILPLTVVIFTYLLRPVTVFAMVRRKFGGFINSFNMFDSVANGKPLSSISSNNS
ncbi:hypothetical protein DERP_000196 [Dermatophagoides pteronyssinus]|uniref:Uncharacterized protein n=1 Tax=Dermatophagoides pteronyssinus TaxID=6956 RepID=A0ABQ8IZT3_DERPT|nr:hypothetical protein DERP_000196 [Dermatophagoides pteronyssinus]